jgi:hypothetical protein
VANSNKDSAAGGTGSLYTTGESLSVTCDNGYSGSGTMYCTGNNNKVSSSWTSVVTCSAAYCPNTRVLNSVSHSSQGSITGRTGNSVTVTCNDGYGSTGAPTVTMTCAATGSTTSVRKGS